MRLALASPDRKVEKLGLTLLCSWVPQRRVASASLLWFTAFQYVCLSPRTSTAPVPDGGEPEVDIHLRVHSLKASEQMWDRVWPRPFRAPQLLHSLCLPMPARCQVQSQASAL